MGAADDLTITAQDTYANTITTYTGSHALTFSGAFASPNGTVPTVNDSAGDSDRLRDRDRDRIQRRGRHRRRARRTARCTSTRARPRASKSPRARSRARPSRSTAPPAPPAKFVLTASTLTPAAAATVNLTTTAQDVYGNTATSYAGAHNLTFCGASASPGDRADDRRLGRHGRSTSASRRRSTFTNGVAAVASSKNGLMRLYRAEASAISPPTARSRTRRADCHRLGDHRVEAGSSPT